MIGLINRLRANPGKRGALMEILLRGTGSMPGCRSYVVAEDAEDEDAVWVTEVWDGEDAHRASLSLPDVKAAIAEAGPLIAGFEPMARTRPLGGFGLTR